MFISKVQSVKSIKFKADIILGLSNYDFSIFGFQNYST